MNHDGPERILTIGVYGFTPDRFFETLVNAGVDLFCDVRARRGLRGSSYSFANSKRLQEQLAELSIRYQHVKELAPSQSVREAQKSEDDRVGTLKRSRNELGIVFKQHYREERLVTFNARAFLENVVQNARNPVLFCVERAPAACHRSLIAEELAIQTGLPVEHLMP